MQSLFSEDTLLNIQLRIKSISNESTRQWGSMKPAQMLWHCKSPLILALKGDSAQIKVNPVKKFVFKLFKASLYNDTPYKQNLPAPKKFVATEEYDLDEEKEKLLVLVEQFHNKKNQQEWSPHPLFGKLTRAQWGKMQFKHLDHHLRQFNA